MTLPELVVFALATWRVASLLVNENGPFRIFRRLREKAGIGHDSEGTIYLVPDGFWPELLSCVWCASIWIAGGWTLVWVFLPKVGVYVALPFALSAAAIFLEKRK